MNKGSKRVIFCASAAFLVGSAFAQAPIIRKGVTEVGGFVGASYGIDQARVMGGGNVVYSLTRELMPFGEFSYFPGIGRTKAVPGLPDTTESFSVPITDFNFGFHLRIPIPKSRVIPYGVISVGGIHSPSRSVVATYPNPFDKTQKVTTTPFDVPSSTNFAVSGGGGLRYYANERMGLRAEFKAYKPSGSPAGTNSIAVFYRVTGGFFFQF